MESNPVNFDAIESYLKAFGNGEVTLSNEYFNRGLAVIYLNNPGKRNAMSGKMMVDLRHCVEQLERWDGKAVLLCGKGGNFCSGGDLDFARASGTKEQGFFMSSWMQDTLKRLSQLPLLVFCLVQGPTLGGGAEISIFSDFIIASEDVKYGFVHGKMGIITAWGGSTRLVRKIGEKRALNLLLTGQVLNVHNCVEQGIVDHVVPADNFFARSLEWIETRIQHHTSVVRLFKQVVNKAATDTFESSLEFEKILFSSTWGAEPNREALAKNIKHLSKNQSKM